MTMPVMKDDLDYFVCEPYEFKSIPRLEGMKTCLRRQASQAWDISNERCADCAQGKKVQQEMGRINLSMDEPHKTDANVRRSRGGINSRRAKPVCSTCGSTEHTRRTCPGIKALRSYDGDNQGRGLAVILPHFKLESEKEKNDMAVHAKCKHEGCEKIAVLEGECSRHFRETHGMTVTEARAQCGSGTAGSHKNTSIKMPTPSVRTSSVDADFSLQDLIIYGKRLIREEVRVALKEMLNAN